MAKGRRPNAQFLPGQGKPGGIAINQFGQNLTNPTERYYYNIYLNMLAQIATNRFIWYNLPDGIPSRFIEQVLVNEGFGCFGPYMGKKVFAKCSMSGPLNIYYQPKERFMISADNLQVEVNEKNSVIVYNTPSAEPTICRIFSFAERLAKLEAFIYVNLNANKTPIILQVPDDKSKLSLKNLYARFEGNEPATISLTKFDSIPIEAIDTGAEWKIDKALSYKKNLWDEIMIWLGIQTSPIQKRERVNVIETLSNVQQTQIIRNIELNQRRIACEEVNALWGTNIDVDFAVIDEVDLLMAERGALNGDNNEVDAADRNNESEQPRTIPER